MATCTKSARSYLSHRDDVCVLPTERYEFLCPAFSTAHLDGALAVKALNLPNYRLLHTPKCYARVTVDKDKVFNTKVAVGSNPEWDESFTV
jgi:C2 domain